MDCKHGQKKKGIQIIDGLEVKGEAKWREITERSLKGRRGLTKTTDMKTERERESDGGREGGCLIWNQDASPVSRVLISSSVSCSSLRFMEPRRLAELYMSAVFHHNTAADLVQSAHCERHTRTLKTKPGQHPLRLPACLVYISVSDPFICGRFFKKRHHDWLLIFGRTISTYRPRQPSGLQIATSASLIR